MRATLGRIVWYVEPFDGRVVAALVQHVNADGSLRLAVFFSSSVQFIDNVGEGGGAARGTWCWPERVS